MHVGRGICIFGTGTCSCAAGHIGEACDTCAPLFARIDGYCVPPLVAAIAPEAPESAPDPVPMLVSVLVAVLLVTCVSVFCVARRHMAGIYDELDCCCCPQSPLVTPTPVNAKYGYHPHAHTSSRNWFGRSWLCRRPGASPVHISGRGESFSVDNASNAGSSSLFVPMPMPYMAGAHDVDTYNYGYGSKESLLASDPELGGIRCQAGDQQSHQEGPAVGTVPVADMYPSIVAMAGGVLSSGRSVEEGLRICVPASVEPTDRTPARDPAILTTDSGQWKQTNKAEALAKAQSEGGAPEEVASKLPTRSEWGVAFSSGTSTWDLSGGMTKMGEVECTPPVHSAATAPGDSELRSGGGVGKRHGGSESRGQLRQPSPSPSPPSMLPQHKPVAGLRQRASALRPPPRPAPLAPPRPVRSSSAGSSGSGSGDVTAEAAAAAPAQRTRSRGRQAMELATMADAAGKLWSVGPSPVHTPQELTPRAEPTRTSSNAVYSKGLWSLDGSNSPLADDGSADEETFTGPTAAGLSSHTAGHPSACGAALSSGRAITAMEVQMTPSTDAMPQSTEMGIDCYRSSTALTSSEQTQSMASRTARPRRDLTSGEFYGSVSDGGTLPWVRANSTAMSAASASPATAAVAPSPEPDPGGHDFLKLGQQVSDLMQQVQAMQAMAAQQGGGAEASGRGQGGGDGATTIAPAGGMSTGSLVEVPSELRAEPSGSVNFIYGGGLPGSRF